MERITVFDGEFWAHKNFPPVKDDTVDEFVDCVKELAARLAAYEETGLEPEEIRDSIGGISPICVQCDGKTSDGIVTEKCGYPDDITKCLEQSKHLCELAQAEKEGRLVVLPCKVGDTVYHITTCEYFPQVLDGTMYGSDCGPGTATGFYCPCELAENCPFDADDFDCNINKKKFAVFEDEVVSLCINDCEMRVELGYSGYVDVSDFGKTVFLTREAAEAALNDLEAEHDR